MGEREKEGGRGETETEQQTEERTVGRRKAETGRGEERNIQEATGREEDTGESEEEQVKVYGHRQDEKKGKVCSNWRPPEQIRQHEEKSGEKGKETREREKFLKLLQFLVRLRQ